MKIIFGDTVKKVKEGLPVYVFYGGNGFAMDETAGRIFAEHPSGINLDVFYGVEASGDDIVESAMTFPFGSNRRTVLVKDAEKLKALYSRKVKTAKPENDFDR